MNSIKHELELKMALAIYREFYKTKQLCNIEEKEAIVNRINNIDVRSKIPKEKDEQYVHFENDENDDIKIRYTCESFDDSSFKSIEKSINDGIILLDCEFNGEYFNDLYEADRTRYNNSDNKANDDFIIYLMKRLLDNAPEYLSYYFPTLVNPAAKALKDGNADLGSTK